MEDFLSCDAEGFSEALAVFYLTGVIGLKGISLGHQVLGIAAMGNCIPFFCPLICLSRASI